MDAGDNLSPTSHEDVNQFLRTLLGNVRSVLGDYFVGMYLYGSLALGDFDPDRSDIDFLVVTGEDLPAATTSGLKTMHARLFEAGGWGTNLEAAYIPVDAVRTYSPTGPACPLANRSNFLVARPESNWVLNRRVLYANGIVIAGPPLRTIIDPVPLQELREAILTLLCDNWEPWTENPDLFQIAEDAQPFVVLTMCRSLCTLETGAVASKTRSAEWAMANTEGHWKELIRQALAWRHGDPPGDVVQTQGFMRYVLRRAGL